MSSRVPSDFDEHVEREGPGAVVDEADRALEARDGHDGQDLAEDLLLHHGDSGATSAGTVGAMYRS
jgi:hypothetical protein